MKISQPPLQKFDIMVFSTTRKKIYLALYEKEIKKAA